MSDISIDALIERARGVLGGGGRRGQMPGTSDPFAAVQNDARLDGGNSSDPFSASASSTFNAPRLGVGDPFSLPSANTNNDPWSSPLNHAPSAFTPFNLPSSPPSLASSASGNSMSLPGFYNDSPFDAPFGETGSVPRPGNFLGLEPILEESEKMRSTAGKDPTKPTVPRPSGTRAGVKKEEDADEFFAGDDEAWLRHAAAEVDKIEVKVEEQQRAKLEEDEPKPKPLDRPTVNVAHGGRASPYFSNGAHTVLNSSTSVLPMEDRPPSRCSSAAKVRFPKLGSRPPSAQRERRASEIRHTRTLAHSSRPISPGHFTDKKQIEPISIHALERDHQTLFTFRAFNEMQSAVFHTAYETGENLVVSAPTGSGKTTVFELAFLRMLSLSGTSSSPLAIYMAPTKALCSERARDWKQRFGKLDVEVREVTGDSNAVDTAFNLIGQADLVVTTPEKWDSVTRRASSESITTRLRLMMVDEVHTLNEERGATLEVLVARMKSKQPHALRFVAVSATVPNINDIARWLGSGKELAGSVEDEVDSTGTREVSSMPKAQVYTFSEAFRPVPLEKLTIGVDAPHDFALGTKLEKQLFAVLNQHSKGLPTLVFCPTRKSCQSTAEQIYKEYDSALKARKRLPWDPQENQKLDLGDAKLSKWSEHGIAVHHAGLELITRRKIEEAFISSKLHLLIATSTLAVGVNLPAHLVVIQGTSCWAGAGNGFREYSDIDIQQMMGRAGRPQYDTSGTVVIMCQQSKLNKYRSMLASNTILESCLHLHLTEHINSEISLGTIKSLKDAQEWLRGTFLSIRVRQNPRHYQTAMVKDHTKSWDETLDRFAENALDALTKSEFITSDEEFIKTKFEKEEIKPDPLPEIVPTTLGQIMSANYVSYQTMCHILTMEPSADVNALLEILAGATEFSSLRIRQGEGAMLNQLRVHEGIRYPIDQAKTFGDKVFLLIQATLGNVSLDEFGTKTENGSPKSNTFTIFTTAPRIARTILAVAGDKKYGAATRSALELLQAINGKAWGDSASVFRQIDSIGPKSIMVLESNGLRTFDDFVNVEPGRLGMWLNRQADFCNNLIRIAKDFPRFSVEFFQHKVDKNEDGYPVVELSVKIKHEGKLVYRRGKNGAVKGSGTKKGQQDGKDSKTGFPVGYNLKVLFLSSKDDGFIDCYSTNTKGLEKEGSKSKPLKIPQVTLYSPEDSVYCHIGIEERSGLTRTFHYKPDVPLSMFPPPSQTAAKTVNGIATHKDAAAKSTKTPLFMPSDDDESIDELIDLTAPVRSTAAGTKRCRGNTAPKQALRKVRLSAARFVDDEAIDDDDEDALDELEAEHDDGSDLDGFVVPDKPAKRPRTAPKWSTAARLSQPGRDSQSNHSVGGNMPPRDKVSARHGTAHSMLVDEPVPYAATQRPPLNGGRMSLGHAMSPLLPKPTVDGSRSTQLALKPPSFGSSNVAGPSGRPSWQLAETQRPETPDVPAAPAAKTEDDEFQELFGEFFGD